MEQDPLRVPHPSRAALISRLLGNGYTRSAGDPNTFEFGSAEYVFARVAVGADVTVHCLPGTWTASYSTRVPNNVVLAAALAATIVKLG